MTAAIPNHYWFQVSPQDIVGEDALFIFKQRNQIYEKQQDSASSIIGSLKDIILEILHECSTGDWDNYNAEPISSKVVHEAFKFIELLPIDINMPDVIPEPSGCIALQWQKSKAHLLSLTITPEGMVSYAFIFGKSEGCGHIQFFDDLPKIIANMLQVVR
jgi:hypothetical protein